jgi:hypothetical protein
MAVIGLRMSLDGIFQKAASRLVVIRNEKLLH